MELPVVLEECALLMSSMVPYTSSSCVVYRAAVDGKGMRWSSKRAAESEYRASSTLQYRLRRRLHMRRASNVDDNADVEFTLVLDMPLPFAFALIVNVSRCRSNTWGAMRSQEEGTPMRR